MKAIANEIIKSIRIDKQNGSSLKTISSKYGIAKSTVSYYCRDLYTYRTRKYQTEEEARNHTNSSKRHICRNCGSPCKKEGGLCLKCYKESTASSKTTIRCRHTITSAKKKEEQQLKTLKQSKRNSIQQIKSPKQLITTSDKKPKPTKTRKQIEYHKRQDSKARMLAQCDDSPTGSHHWNINSENIGTCRYCHTVKDMTTNTVIKITKNNYRDKQEKLSLNDRYNNAWCRITTSLIKDGLSVDDAVRVCAVVVNTKDNHTIEEVQTMESEADTCPPVPDNIRLMIDNRVKKLTDG